MASTRLPPADGIAAGLSSLCVVHCLALPLVAASLPTLAFGPGHDQGPAWVHWALLLVSLPVSAYALWRGALIHRERRYWRIAAVGFALMAAGALAHGLGTAERVLTIAGGLTVALAHWRNWRSRTPA
ncbi:MerC domain-containing protein [Thermaurantiacus sp.]